MLPQFGLDGEQVAWGGYRRIEGDEFVHYFSRQGSDYALIFEDHDGLGRNDQFIKEHILGAYAAYEFVNPISMTGNAPTYDGFRLPTPSVYAEGVTGSFTLLQLLEQAA